MRRWWLPLLIVIGLLASPGRAFADYCGNPYDWIPDDQELQACLNRGGTIRLEPGWPGYIVNGLNGDVTKGVQLTRSLTVLTSAGGMARVIAGRDLFGTILGTAPGGLSNFAIRNVYFDGMVDVLVNGAPYRTRREECTVGGSLGNVTLVGHGFTFENSVSVSALCGSGLGVLGSNFIVVNNYVSHNGRDKYARIAGFPWADGMTVLFCDRGYIAHNVLVDNTDIDLVIGGSRNCVVELNTIAHFGKYAFAGLNVGSSEGGGDHTGSQFRRNTVYSAVPDRLAMGILIGSHPWTLGTLVRHAGSVVGNVSRGNVFNLVVEGVEGGVVEGNELSNPRGQDSNCGPFGGNYMVNPYHVWGTRLQPGWTPFQFDEWRCGPL